MEVLLQMNQRPNRVRERAEQEGRTYVLQRANATRTMHAIIIMRSNERANGQRKICEGSDEQEKC